MTEVVPKITIKELRARHNLTQEEFAKTVGTTPQTVSAWEKNVLSISPKNMVTICKKYNLQSSDLYGF
ncbi:cro-like protein [Streptococcus phage CHPC979]|uniref:Cro-like protein n=2 Tax=Moineauvirus TaxID=1623304 RepID=A0A3G8F7C1_9CAUD|nr:cro-like protein [Streptococcus phage CHPC875]YP_010646336.1 cro-like protein [Streptococcus phage CHPC979]AZF90681.1 cro-like protein [Streptococcus phage CHPC875]AZF92498.1 cro-like protein [Streptococcus phage CHPC979]